MDRRQLLKAGFAWPFAVAGSAFAKDPIFIGDMHFHLLFIGPNPAASNPLARNLAGGRATLVAWSLVGDLPWMGVTPRGFKQKSVPKQGETVTWFQAELARVKAHIAEQNLKIVKGPDDVDLALKGDPHVVLSVEGASFLDDDPSQLQAAYDAGIRHIQLVHYIRNSIGDFQTEKPQHGGLSDRGKKVVQECKPAGHSGRPRAQHTRCGDAGAGRLQGADGVVAQLCDEDQKAAVDDVGDAGPAIEPRGREGHRPPRAVWSACGRCGRMWATHRRLTPTGCPRWPIGWGRITRPSAPT
jgi:hypothetical protein